METPNIIISAPPPQPAPVTPKWVGTLCVRSSIAIIFTLTVCVALFLKVEVTEPAKTLAALTIGAFFGSMSPQKKT